MLQRGGLISLVTLLCYLWLAPAHIVDPDNAEFATLGSIGGAAHPSGYPLYLLWLRALHWLPGHSPAHTTALATAIIGALVALVLHAACRAWGARPLGATLVVAAFAASPIVLRISTEAEVFSLNLLIVAAVLWLAAGGGPLRGARRAAALGLVAGLGLANHMTCALVAPVGLLGVVRGVREANRAPFAIMGALAGLVIGLMPYAYLWITPDTPLSWGKVDTFDGLVRTVTRADYGVFDLVAAGTSGSLSAHVAALATMLARTWIVIGALAGVVMLIWRIVRPGADGESRWGWAMLALSFVLAGPLLLSRFNLAPTGLSLFICNRFHLLPAELLAIPIAVALVPLDAYVARTKVGADGACAIVATVGFVALVSASLPYLSRVHTPAVEYAARNLLTALPPNAVLFDGTDEEYLSMGYVQWALGQRQDVTIVAPQLAGAAWYSRRIAARGIVAPDGQGPPIERVVEHLLGQGRPVFAEKSQAPIISAFPTYPYATVMRVLPRGSSIPSFEETVVENEAIYAKFVMPYARPDSDSEFATAVHRRYAATWLLLGRKLAGVGRIDEAARANEIAREIGPR